MCYTHCMFLELAMSLKLSETFSIYMLHLQLYCFQCQGQYWKFKSGNLSLSDLYWSSRSIRFDDGEDMETAPYSVIKQVIKYVLNTFIQKSQLGGQSKNNCRRKIIRVNRSDHHKIINCQKRREVSRQV